MTRNAKLYVADIRQAILKIQKYTKSLTFKKFTHSDMVVDAVIRNFNIIGEAVKNIPLNVRQQYNTVPWQKITAMRNMLTHEYFGTDLTILWKTIKEDIPLLKKEIEKILKNT